MVDEKVTLYIQRSIAGGCSVESVKRHLLATDWSEQEVEEVFAAAQLPAAPPPEVVAVHQAAVLRMRKAPPKGTHWILRCLGMMVNFIVLVIALCAAIWFVPDLHVMALPYIEDAAAHYGVALPLPPSAATQP